MINKPGGTGTVGMVYMNQHAGDGHYLSMANATLKYTKDQDQVIAATLADLGLLKAQ